MAPDEEFLPTSSYVVLGLLSFGRDLTGYEVRAWAQDAIKYFWATPAMSQIYRELERLDSLGFVRSRDDSGDQQRARTVYRLTPAGRRELTRWLERAPVPEPEIRHGAALRLFFGHMTDRDRLRDILDTHLAWAQGMLDGLIEIRASLESDPDTWRYALLLADWGDRFYGGDLDGARHAREGLAP